MEAGVRLLSREDRGHVGTDWEGPGNGLASGRGGVLSQEREEVGHPGIVAGAEFSGSWLCIWAHPGVSSYSVTRYAHNQPTVHTTCPNRPDSPDILLLFIGNCPPADGS